MITVEEQEEPSMLAQADEPIIMTGREVAAQIRRQCIEEITSLRARHSILPGLAIVRVGDDPASINYADRITQSFGKAGLKVTIIALPPNSSRSLLQAELARLNVLPEIAGVIVQMPLPTQMGVEAVIDVLDPQKDVDGIHPVNIGRLALGLDAYVPATPAGGIAILDHYGISIEGKRALVVGRSSVVGKPLAQLLLARNATVTVAHSRTRDLPALIREADILASAVGSPGFITGDDVRPGAAVLDFGAAIMDGRMTGDIDYSSALHKVSAITPVPGGTGPVTSAMLLRNTIKAMGLVLGH